MKSLRIDMWYLEQYDELHFNYKKKFLSLHNRYFRERLVARSEAKRIWR